MKSRVRINLGDRTQKAVAKSTVAELTERFVNGGDLTREERRDLVQQIREATIAEQEH